MWLIVFFLVISGSFAHINEQEADRLDLPDELVAGNRDTLTKCSVYSAMEPSFNLDIPEKCCHFGTQECHFTYNGVCRLRWDTADCDYTVDVCQTEHEDHTANWFCTCCASCHGDDKSNDCTINKGVCRRCCHDDEFSAFWHHCSNNNCMCCKEKCPSDTCVSGTGICVYKTHDCPKGYSISNTDKCQGIDCQCCKENDCQNETCASGEGMCVLDSQHCPKGYYVSTDDHCEGPNCKCCKKYDCQGQTCALGEGMCVLDSQSCPEGSYVSTDDHCEGHNCKCCKKYDCQGQTCASGKGKCVFDFQSCPQGSYVSTDDDCEGPNCKCCHPCERDEQCAMKQGFCEWRNRQCPLNYIEDDCCCPDRECRCCRPGLNGVKKFLRSDRAIRIQQNQEMDIDNPQNP